MGALNAAAGLWMDEHVRPATPVADLALHLVCEGPLLERKLRALRAHRSQTQPLIDLVGEPVFRRWWATESFADARAAAGLAVSSASMTGSQGLRP